MCIKSRCWPKNKLTSSCLIQTSKPLFEPKPYGDCKLPITPAADPDIDRNSGLRFGENHIEFHFANYLNIYKDCLNRLFVIKITTLCPVMLRRFSILQSTQIQCISSICMDHLNSTDAVVFYFVINAMLDNFPKSCYLAVLF